MQPLKGLVIGMGVLIVIGMSLLVYGLVREFGGEDDAPAATASDPASPRAATFGEIDVSLPAGCRIIEMQPAETRLFLRLEGAESCPGILVIDLASGSELGRINLRPAP